MHKKSAMDGLWISVGTCLAIYVCMIIANRTPERIICHAHSSQRLDMGGVSLAIKNGSFWVNGKSCPQPHINIASTDEAMFVYPGDSVPTHLLSYPAPFKPGEFRRSNELTASQNVPGLYYSSEPYPARSDGALRRYSAFRESNNVEYRSQCYQYSDGMKCTIHALISTPYGRLSLTNDKLYNSGGLEGAITAIGSMRLKVDYLDIKK